MKSPFMVSLPPTFFLFQTHTHTRTHTHTHTPHGLLARLSDSVPSCFCLSPLLPVVVMIEVAATAMRCDMMWIRATTMLCFCGDAVAQTHTHTHPQTLTHKYTSECNASPQHATRVLSWCGGGVNPLTATHGSPTSTEDDTIRTVKLKWQRETGVSWKECRLFWEGVELLDTHAVGEGVCAVLFSVCVCTRVCLHVDGVWTLVQKCAIDVMCVCVCWHLF